MENQLIIIDGSSMLVTAYYGNLPKALLFEKDPEKKKELYSQIMKNEHGRYTNALYVMCRTLDKIMAEQKQQEELQKENEVLDKKQLKAAKKLEKKLARKSIFTE